MNTAESSLSSSRSIGSCFSLDKETKKCGHFCFPSSTENCCACMDLRPTLEGDFYETYVDGRGWVNESSRNDMYCPICNPKNYTEWLHKIEAERKAKESARIQSAADEQARLAAHAVDQLRASVIAPTSGTFEYSSGDTHEGEFCDGKRNGKGTTSYADGSVYSGDWKDDVRHGSGTMNWCDGITYTGEWCFGRMHGRGRYVMADGTVLEGLFIEDEFSE